MGPDGHRGVDSLYEGGFICPFTPREGPHFAETERWIAGVLALTSARSLWKGTLSA